MGIENEEYIPSAYEPKPAEVPTSEDLQKEILAKYLAEQHGVKREDYLKDGLTDDEFIAEYEHKPIGASTINMSEDNKQDNSIDPLIGAAAGLGVAHKIEPAVAGANLAKLGHEMYQDYQANKLIPPAAGYETPHGVSAPGVNSAAANEGIVAKNKAMMASRELPGYSSPGNSRILMPDEVASSLEAEATKNKPFMSKVKDFGKSASSSITPKGLSGKVVNSAMPYLSLPSAGYQATEAYNHWNEGDTGRALLSGLGAAGSLASMVPYAPVRGIGTAVAMGAPALDAIIYNDALKNNKNINASEAQKDAVKKLSDPNYFKNLYSPKKPKFANGGLAMNFPLKGGISYGLPGFADGGQATGFAALLEDPSKTAAALSDFLSMNNVSHQNWYKGAMPRMMNELGKKSGIGKRRSEGSPRDAAEEFAGAADWGQRAPADYNRAVNNADLYQRFHNTGKNAADNFVQDQAGLALGVCNPDMSKKNIVKQAIQYGLNPDGYLR